MVFTGTLWKKEIDEESVSETLTEEIHKHFHGGYNLIWGDWLA
jgi:hypothetical protein